MTRILLDKNVVRYWTIALLKRANDRKLTQMQEKALLYVETHDSLFITQETYHILTYRAQLPELVPYILSRTRVLYITKYFKRWVRRVQDLTSLTREDAVLLAYGTFSTDTNGFFLGTNILVPTDKGFYSEFHDKKTKLDDRLNAMVISFGKPWNQVNIPKVNLINNVP